MPRPLTQGIIEQWLTLIKGSFWVQDIWNDVGIESPEGKQHLRVILGRLEQKGLVSSDGARLYRKLDMEAPIIEWQAADPNKTLSLKFPFGEHQVCKIYPKSVVIVTAPKNEGKTAYLYNFIKQNMNDWDIDLYNSETSPEQMNERFAPLDIPIPAPFRVYERYDHFADVIDPNRISVIDYLDMNSEVYLVGAEIDAIFRKLKDGVAVIALQKPPPTITYVKGEKKVFDRDLAYGGGFTAKRAVLYISMGGNKLKLLYVKTPSQRNVNPNNMSWKFNIGDDGIHFENVARFYGEDA